MSDKGFAFSVDAMFAIAVVVILAAAYANLYLVEKADVEAAKSTRQQAIDAAMVSFYTRPAGGGIPPPLTGAYGYCARAFRYDFATGVTVDVHCVELG
ncbi:MAG: hypothetical protein ABID38_00835 [Candidatus Diapherotrites archaeon]